MTTVRNRGSINLTDWGLLIIRVMIGWLLIYHGAQKLFGAFGGSGMAGFVQLLSKLHVPMPTVSAYLSALTEFCGGLVLVAGTGTRIAAVVVCFNMGVAVWAMHAYGFSGPQGGYQLPLIVGVVVFGLLVSGPGRLTLGGLLRGLRPGGGAGLRAGS